MSRISRPVFDRLKAAANRCRLFEFGGDQFGTVMVMFAVVSPIVLGAAGLAVEASYWQLRQRAMQNAADSAAIAAGMEGGSNYVAVAQSKRRDCEQARAVGRRVA